jgi:hypothetical protein
VQNYTFFLTCKLFSKKLTSQHIKNIHFLDYIPKNIYKIWIIFHIFHILALEKKSQFSTFPKARVEELVLIPAPYKNEYRRINSYVKSRMGLAKQSLWSKPQTSKQIPLSNPCAGGTLF